MSGILSEGCASLSYPTERQERTPYGDSSEQGSDLAELIYGPRLKDSTTI